MGRLGFIVNAASGNGRGAKVWAAVERELSARGVPYDAFRTEASGHATALAQRMVRERAYDSITAIGGDGTVNEVAAGLLGSGAALGHIGAGSGNDFARAMGLPSEPGEAVEALVRGERLEIDVGRAGGRVFVNSFGSGFDGEVAARSNGSPWKRWMNKIGLGAVSYGMIVLAALGAYRPARVHVALDGRSYDFDNVWLVVAANLPYLGGGMHICPGASATDGVMDVCVVHGLGRLRLLRHFPLIYRGAHVSLPYVTMLRGERLSLKSDRALACHVDGETAEPFASELTLVPRGLSLIVPERR
ncbi:diacylglycerol kinase family lipid kinase [Paenibacillus sp.]|uniref:diacylglycerol/lipid kinase family protein n=1 Tax=Paenibacillus sp. TaxID=58172 RepID=UPI002811F013|nr:diacylglycerol kinase family lipid kinase [Paenibacillus sp.]